MPDESKISKAQQKAVNKYINNNYDRVNLTVPKGKKEILQVHAQSKTESLNAFINRAIDETMERESSTPAATLENTHSATVITELPEPQQKAHKKLTPEAEKSIDLAKLLKDVRYQLDIGLTYGEKVLASLMEKARKPAEENGG